MGYENAAIISEILHYIITLGVTLIIIVKYFRDLVKLILKLYGLFFIWGSTCYILQGCPLTLFENWISKKIYDKPFYPDYTFTDTDFYYLISNTDFYIPAALVLIITGVKYINKNNDFRTN